MEIPPNATVRLQFRTNGRSGKLFGPYRYAEWKEGKKVRTKYLGRDFASRAIQEAWSLEGTDRQGLDQKLNVLDLRGRWPD